MQRRLLLDCICYMSLMLISLGYSVSTENYGVLMIASAITLSYGLVVQRILKKEKERKVVEIYSKYY